MNTMIKRETFSTQNGFILACVGSAVSIGNIWLFPIRLSRFGGATFLIPYLICVIFVTFTGVIGEIAFGRLARGGPIKAYTLALKEKYKNSKLPVYLGVFSNTISLVLAIGYFVVFSWILRYLYSALNGSLFSNSSIAEFSSFFSDPSLLMKYVFLFGGIIIIMLILVSGISNGIERVNKIVMPLFYIILAFSAIFIARIPGASEGYRFLFDIHPEQLLNPMIWVYALGQSFFSLALTGSGLMVYGSFLRRMNNIPKCAIIIALFDTLASLLAGFIIIPAMAITGHNLESGGIGMLFVYLPYVFNLMPGGRILFVLFFTAFLIAAATTLINLIEVPVLALESHLSLAHEWATWCICALTLILSFLINNFVSIWIDVCSIYLVPLSAAATGIVFYWILNKQTCLEAINTGSNIKIGNFLYTIDRYLYCGSSLLVFILGAIYQGIG